ncbi:MAG: hypothetical protein ACI8UP_002487 [Porticoccaceae bacterium]|jgi:hypothetical protein
MSLSLSKILALSLVISRFADMQDSVKLTDTSAAVGASPNRNRSWVSSVSIAVMSKWARNYIPSYESLPIP